MPAQRNGLPPSVGRISRSDIRRASHTPRPRHAEESRPRQAGFGSPTPDSGNEKSRRPRIADGGLCQVARLSAARPVQLGEMRGRRSSSGPCPSGRWRTVALGQAHLADEAPAMPAHEQVAAHRQLSAEVQLPIEKVADRATSSRNSALAGLLEMLQGGEDLQAGAMQQHPDIGKRDIQEITDSSSSSPGVRAGSARSAAVRTDR